MLSIDEIVRDKEDMVEATLKAIRQEFASGGEQAATIELTKRVSEIRDFSSPDWIRFKVEVSGLHSLSEKDMKTLRGSKITPIKSGWEVGLDMTNQGKIQGGLKNCSIIVKEHERLRGLIRWNEFLQRPVLTGNVPFLQNIKIEESGWMEINADVMPQLRCWLAMDYAEFSKECLADAVANVALKDRFNPLTDLLEKCEEQWDKVPRIDTWLFDLCEAKSTPETFEYVKVVGAKWLISAVARAYQPGCKVDTMLILEGEQGEGKSKFLRELSFGYFLELLTDISKGKDVVDKLLGKWIVEMPELRALSGDREANKAFISQQADFERLSYAQRSQTYPRRCVFIGTTNESNYLNDETGERRYWPVEVGKCDLDKLKKCLTQIWGEAVSRYKKGEKWWIEDDSVILASRSVHAEKTASDEMTPMVNAWLQKAEMPFHGIDVWGEVFGGRRDNFEKTNQMRVAKILKSLGCVRNAKDKTWAIK